MQGHYNLSFCLSRKSEQDTEGKKKKLAVCLILVESANRVVNKWLGAVLRGWGETGWKAHLGKPTFVGHCHVV